MFMHSQIEQNIRFQWKWLLWALVCLGGLPAWAATQTVTTTQDDGPGSLRMAMRNAASGDTIQLSVTGVITLASALPQIGNNLAIIGPGADRLAVSGGGAVQVFWIEQGATVSLAGFTIQDANDSEGAVTNFGTLTLNHMLVRNNVGTEYSGGILNESALTVTNSTFSGNTGSSGGAILNFGQLVVTNSTFSGNAATYGGAIYSNVDVFDPPGRIDVTNATFSGNNGTSGGGIYNDANSTLTIKSTLFAGNNGGNCTLGGPVTSQGYNLSDDSTCTSGFTTTTDKDSVGAGLDPRGLQNNGGPIPTIALLPASAAVDDIPAARCTDTLGKPVVSDERGIARPQGPGCDVGAFELVEAIPFSSFSAQLELATGKLPGFNLTARFTLASGQTLTPTTEPLTLTLGSYQVTLPAGTLHQVQVGPFTDYGYIGIVNKVGLDVQIIPLGSGVYGFQVAGTPVTLMGNINPVTVTLTTGKDTGTATVRPLVLH
jgi:hypothetical protein